MRLGHVQKAMLECLNEIGGEFRGTATAFAEAIGHTGKTEARTAAHSLRELEHKGLVVIDRANRQRIRSISLAPEQTTCHRPERWWNPTTGKCEHTDHDDTPEQPQEEPEPDTTGPVVVPDESPVPAEEVVDLDALAAVLLRKVVRYATTPPRVDETRVRELEQEIAHLSSELDGALILRNQLRAERDEARATAASQADTIRILENNCETWRQRALQAEKKRPGNRVIDLVDEETRQGLEKLMKESRS